MDITDTSTTNYFDPDVYIDDLMEDIGFKDASDEERQQMREGLSEQLTRLILNAISLYVEPDQIDEAIVQYGDLEDLAQFIRELVKISPEAQLAIAEALDNFYNEMLETYQRFHEV